MSKLKRYYYPGQVYFVTPVTFNRNPMLVRHADTLLDSIRATHQRLAFEILAWAILPDHFHMVVNPDSNNLSGIVGRIKQSFSHRLRIGNKKQNSRVWQNRFWDHVIRDQTDLHNHIDYIHFNPVRHQVADAPTNWQHSSFNLFLSQGFYEANRRTKEPPKLEGEYGE